MKKFILSTYTAIILILSCVLLIFPLRITVAFADGISSGNAVATTRPVDDGYIWLTLIFFALDIVAGVFLVKNIITLIKLNKTKTILGFFPHAIATFFTLKQVEIILSVEIILLLILYLTTRFLSRKIQKIKQR